MHSRERRAPTATERSNLRSQIERESLSAVSARSHVHHSVLQKVLDGAPVATTALEKLARIVPRVRTADEFSKAAAMQVNAPRPRPGIYSWSLEKIRNARDLQMQGNFEIPVKLAEAMRTDDAIFTARGKRLDPQSAIGTELVSAGGVRGDRARERARNSVIIGRDVLRDIHGTFVDHGVAIGYLDHEPNADGTLIDMRMREWPLEFVRTRPNSNDLYTRTADLGLVDIVHGDGHWVVFRRSATKPWTKDACVLPAALVWAAHAEGLADWAGATRAHGLSKILGMLKEGTAITDADGRLTPTAATFLQMMLALGNGDSPAGIAPPGSTVNFLANGSTAWQVFAELITNREKASERIYQGTDATLGAQGGAPGVDISVLFEVATTKVQGDFQTIEFALKTGAYEPWTAINDGDSRYAPWLRYQMPDPDAEQKREQRAAGYKRLTDTIQAMRDQKLEVQQKDVDVLCELFAVSPAPRLADITTQVSTVQLAPTDIAKVVRVSEARASQGLPPFNDERDNMTITELDARTAAQAAAAAQPAPATPTGGAQQ